MATKQYAGAQAPDGSMYVVLADGAGNLTGANTSGLPAGATIVANSSGNVAAATATATLPAAVGKTTYISGWSLTGAGATAGTIVNLTVAGLTGGTHTHNVVVPAGVTTSITPMDQNYTPPIPASATNTAIVVSVPTFGAGNTNVAVSAWGYQI